MESNSVTEKEKTFAFDTTVNVPYEKSEIKTFIVTAPTEELAKARLQDKLNTDNIVCVGIKKKQSAIPAIIAFSIALFFTFTPYYKGFAAYHLSPDVKSVFFALLIYAAFVVRIKGIEKTAVNFSDLIVSIMAILLLAVFIRVFAKDAKEPTNFFARILALIGIKITNYGLLAFAIIFSWLGVKLVSAVMLLLIALLGLSELFSMGVFMGDFKSVTFMISSFFGFIFYLKYEGPKMINSVMGASTKAFNFFNSNISEGFEYAKEKINSRTSPESISEKRVVKNEE